MRDAGGVRRHVASNPDVFFHLRNIFAENTHGRQPAVALFFLFSEKTRPWIFGTCFGDFELKNNENHDYLLNLSIFRGVFFHLRSIDKNQKGN